MKDYGDSFAHGVRKGDAICYQTLQEHLRAVAQKASQFCASFGASDWGSALGWLHDIGKVNPAYQAHLRQRVTNDEEATLSSSKIDHSTAGAQLAVEHYGILGHLLAYAITGHHGGLMDAIAEGTDLNKRLKKTLNFYPELPKANLPSSLELPPFIRKALKERHAFTLAFFVRMLFSALVDGDFLDTEAFMRPDQARLRSPWKKDIFQTMEKALSDYLVALEAKPGNTEIHRLRKKIRKSVEDKASMPPGFFSLTVPTGGGKTLTSLSFALKHLLTHQMSRIIYVIPYTSIIEQTAEIYRKVFAPLETQGIPNPVLEHHSNFDPQKETPFLRIATENWDSPLIVTTAVQFYESLFAHKPSQCRKLHRLSRSIIILDEVQILPVELLKPSLAVLKELVAHYGATVLLCTATQPAFQKRRDFPIGIDGVRELAPEPSQLYLKFQRVRVNHVGHLSHQDLVEKLLPYPQVLCIVNTRREARELYTLAKNEKIKNLYHLSALMCPAHRSEVLKTIKEKLSKKEPCRVIATQLVEAGVDLDFPVVFRALAGLDSLVQAAGRCNRHGHLPQGEVFVFEGEKPIPFPGLESPVNCAKQVLACQEDPFSLEAVEHYFRLYFWEQSHQWDRHGVLEDFALQNQKTLPFLFQFIQASKKYKLIQDHYLPVIIPWGEKGRGLTESLRKGELKPSIHRKLQPFTVTIPSKLWYRHIHRDIEWVHEQFPILISLELHYSEETGLSFEDDPKILIS